MTEWFIIAGENQTCMETTQVEHENTYMVLFLLGAIILVFSLYLNVYLLFRAAFV